MKILVNWKKFLFVVVIISFLGLIIIKVEIVEVDMIFELMISEVKKLFGY